MRVLQGLTFQNELGGIYQLSDLVMETHSVPPIETSDVYANIGRFV